MTVKFPTLPSIKLPALPNLSLFASKTKTETKASVAGKTTSTDTLVTEGAAKPSKPVLKTSIAPETPVQTDAPKTLTNHVLSALNVARKGLTAIGIAPLLGAWAVLALACVVFSPVVGAVVASAYALKSGSGRGAAFAFAAVGFQAALDNASTTSMDMLKNLTDAVRITK